MNIVKGIITGLFIFSANVTVMYTQVTDPYQTGVSAQKNLDAIARVGPYMTGGMGFDTRYQGVVGSPLIFNKLLPSLVKVYSEAGYLSMESDLDAYENKLLFSHPSTGKLMYIPSDIIEEVVVNPKDERIVFRTTKDKQFDPPIDKIKFYQVMYSKSTAVVKIAFKKMIPADYQKAYSADRRYDEFDTKYSYYYLGNDAIFHKVPPNKKTLLMLFPEQKKLIESSVGKGQYESNDAMFNDIVKKIAASDSAK
jgi:hypothetical protein